ncbi:hypothetical protein EYC84_005601 [Monilinia fructicola]|uniref:Uncharacterized protein n=1 Tax=Monilinia fructicola TaxID=38448 RepID=A0A5M9JZJ2_MONFR|nr:hypothetical protein EYC84_005601 [Monilinia fructicola]
MKDLLQGIIEEISKYPKHTTPQSTDYDQLSGFPYKNLLYRSRYVSLMQFFHLDMNDFHAIGLFFLYLIVLPSVTFDLFCL